MIKKICAGAMAVLFTVSAARLVIPTAEAQVLTFGQLIELFISIGVIAPDKAAAARAAVSSWSSGDTTTTILPVVNGMTIHLTSSLVASDKAYPAGTMYIDYRVTFDGTKYDPAYITIQPSCPAGVTAILSGTTSSYPCGQAMNMTRLSDSEYDASFKFVNSNAYSVTVGASAQAYGASGAIVGAGDKDALTLAAGGTTQPPVLTSAVANVTGTPILTLAYDNTNKESLLTASFNVSVTSGANATQLWTEGSGLRFIDQNGKQTNTNSNFTKMTVLSNAERTTDSFGRSFVIIPVGQTVNLQIVGTIKPSQMFAGTYHSIIDYLYTNSGDSQGTLNPITVLSRSTNSKVIIGETSPYLTSVTNTVAAGGTLTVSGQRLGNSSIWIDRASIGTTLPNSRDTTFYIVTPSSLKPGNHSLVLKDSVGQESNLVGFNISDPSSAGRIDLKVNGSDMPATISFGSPFTVSWTSKDATYCNGYGQDFSTGDNTSWTNGNLPASGSKTVYAKSAGYDFPAYYSTVIGIQCWSNALGGTTSSTKTVPVTVTRTSVQPSLTVLSPNGGERIEKGKTVQISWSSNGISKFDVILDQRLENGVPGDMMLASGITSATYQWTVPTSITSIDQDAYAGQYRILVRESCGPNMNSSCSYSGTGHADDSNDWFSVVSPMTSTSASVSLIGSPTLSLSYDSARSEASLIGSQYVNIAAGSSDLYVTGVSMNIKENTGVVAPHGLVPNGTSYTVAGTTNTQQMTIADNYGNNALVWKIKAGQTASFKPQISLNPKLMYAGNYAAFLGYIGILDNGNYSTLPFNSSNSSYVTILGEKGAGTVSTGSLSVAPNLTRTNSHGTVKLSYTTHSNAVTAKLYLSCPAGVSAYRGESGINDCNSWYTFPMVPSGSTYTFVNGSGQAQNVVPNFYEYLSDNPNYANGVSTQVTVDPEATVTVSSCTDSDGGQNPDVAGLTDGRVNGLGSYFNDASVASNGGQCSGTSCTAVAEGYCTADGKVTNTLMQCSSGYSAGGACATKPVSTAPATITVLSPNGGESVHLGDNLNITWTSSNIPSNLTTAYILLTDANGADIVYVSQSVAISAGSYYWHVGEKSTLGPGTYKIKMAVYNSNTGTFEPYDLSDGAFNIADYVTMPTASVYFGANQLGNLIQALMR